MKISLVVPVFNEEEAIPIFYKTVREFEELKQHEVEIVFIDGSKDATESIINALAIADPLVVPLSFTRNFGKEPALFAGLTMRLVMQLSLLMSTCRTLLKLFRT
jgi:glycosyltransferase involved in cell wall biosynthesis